MKPIILIAPPQAGKAILSKKLVEVYNLPHISTGDLLRAEVASGSTFGQELKAKMDAGLLIEDATMIQLILNRISEEDAANGYILDGFPRTLAQAKAYDEALAAKNLEAGNIFVLEIPFELALKRVVGRVVCPKCGASYNTILAETLPKVEGICDLCEAELVKRSDDNEEALTKRYQVYGEDTEPIIEYYEPTGRLHHINSEAKEIAFNQVAEILGKDN